ncbi:MAG: LPS export ABC transporter periplasmic protein LptC [Armatimonadota bacterium]|nr:LPS export ABC transporter periplasmic protein LptC [Armatimonadota bacterium]
MLSTRARRLLAGLLLVAAAGAAAWLVSTLVTRPEEPRDDAREAGAPAVSIRESMVEHSRGGEPAWRLSIEDLQISGGGRTVAAAGLREGLVYDEGKPVVRISAGEAIYNTSDKSFEVTGGVKVVSHQGAIITTGTVQWLPASQTLHCPGEVTLRAEGITVRTENLDLIVPKDIVRTTSRVQLRTEHGQLTGRDLTYNLKTRDYTLRSVQAVFTVESAREELERLQ